jgi:hypothetical protein
VAQLSTLGGIEYELSILQSQIPADMAALLYVADGAAYLPQLRQAFSN